MTKRFAPSGEPSSETIFWVRLLLATFAAALLFAGAAATCIPDEHTRARSTVEAP